MSELSDFVSAQLHSLMTDEAKAASVGPAFLTEGHAGLAVPVSETGFDSVNGFTEHMAYGNWVIARGLRRCIRLHGGRDWSDDINEAMDMVKNDCAREMLSVVLMAMADGILMGKKPIPVIKKYQLLKDIEHVWMAPSFRTEADLIALDLSNDDELRQGLRQYLINCVYVTGASAGARTHGGLVQGNQIFDVWMMGTGTAVFGAYIAGTRLGQKQEEDAVLEGIMSASTTEETTEEEKS